MSKCIIVLGMHRSATSLCAGGLKKANVKMGNNLLGADSSNIFGHFEDIDFMNLNKKILAAAGGSWDLPPPENTILNIGKRLAPEIKSLVDRKKSKLWGWKDPRTTLTVKLYLPYIENPHFFCCFRDPMEVAKSLAARNGFPIPKGLELAEIYNRRLLCFLEQITKQTGWSNITF